MEPGLGAGFQLRPALGRVERNEVGQVSWWDGDPWASPIWSQRVQTWVGGVGKWSLLHQSTSAIRPGRVLLSNDRKSGGTMGRCEPGTPPSPGLPGIEERPGSATC